MPRLTEGLNLCQACHNWFFVFLKKKGSEIVDASIEQGKNYSNGLTKLYTFFMIIEILKYSLKMQASNK